MKTTRELWGKTACGKEIYLYTLENESGAYVQVSNVGAAIISVVVPDKDGKLADVALGYAKPESYFGDGPCMGKTPGRYANRVALGKFTLEGKEYTLPVNCGPNHLHGGPEGFQNKVWESREHEGGVEFLYYSEDGEQGYPGAVKAVVRYEWTDECELRMTYTAESDAPTVINLTNHAYFNLNGEGNGNILGHTLRMNCSEYLPTDETQIPLGESAPVAGTPMDFVNEKPVGQDIRADFDAIRIGTGYDHCWVIDGAEPGQLQFCCELYAPESGRTLNIYTTQPGVQVYTGNWLEGCPEGKNGHVYNNNDGIAIECQNYPDGPNKADYPNCILRPGEVFEEAIIYAFGTR